MASSQRGQVLFFLDLLRGALEGNSNRTIYSSWGRGLHVKERTKPFWLAARAEWWVLRSGGGGPMKSSLRRTHLHRNRDDMHSGYGLFLGEVQAPRGTRAVSLVPRLLCAQLERHPKAEVPAGRVPGWYCWRGIPDTQYLGPGLHWG